MGFDTVGLLIVRRTGGDLVEPTQIQIPANLTAASALRLGSTIDSVSLADKYVFNLGGLGYVEPFGMLLCASLIRRFIRERTVTAGRDLDFRAIGHQDNSYAAHMGFYHSFGLSYGKEPGQASGSASYLPITRLRLSALRAAAGYQPLGAEIEREAHRLAHVLLQGASTAATELVAYAILEMMRNVPEHSESDDVWYAAQYWSKRDLVEIAILDEGIGLRRSLRRNPKLTVPDDTTALDLALQPGITGSVSVPSGLAVADAYGDPWANTGYGLYITSNLCAQGGVFQIASGTTVLQLSKTRRKTLPTRVEGTAVRLQLQTTNSRDLRSMILRILQGGHVGGGRSRSPQRGA